MKRTCSALSVHDAAIFCRNGLEHDAVDDSEENHRCVQSTQHILDSKLVARVPAQLVENEPAGVWMPALNSKSFHFDGVKRVHLQKQCKGITSLYKP